MKRSTEVRPPERKGKDRPALTPEERQKQIAAKAMDLAERRIEEGVATSQEIVYWLKTQSREEELSNRLIEAQVKLKEAQAEALESQKQTEEIARKAYAAIQKYAGAFAQSESEDEEDY